MNLNNRSNNNNCNNNGEVLQLAKIRNSYGQHVTGNSTIGGNFF